MIYGKEGVTLVPLTREHTQNKIYRNWFTDQEVCKYNSHGNFPYTDEDFDSFADSLKSNDKLVFAILFNSAIADGCGIEENALNINTHIGNISLQEINSINRTAELAIIIGEKEYWGKGYGHIACELLLNHGFKRLNLNKIYLGTADENFGMISLATKLEMKLEGTQRQELFLDGNYMDILHYGILKEEWLKNV